MTQDIHDVMAGPYDLLALGEPTHQEPAFGRIRNELFARLAGRGFRSIALETDRVAAFAVDDFVREGVGSLDEVMSEGFSHGFGALDANRRLVAWMREYNRARPPEERLAFHGFDIPTENTSAPSPRPYLARTRDYLRLDLDLDLDGLAGDDDRWSRTEAVMDPAMSPGATAEADRLRAIADDLLTTLYARAPELIAAGSRHGWQRARARLTAGIGLLGYHGQAARRDLGPSARVERLLATRDALMARNLLDIREAEARRGPTLVFAHNLHLRRTPSSWSLGELSAEWSGAGAIVASLLGGGYGFVAGSLGRSEALGLGEPAPDTYEGRLQRRTGSWTLVPAATVSEPAGTRTDTSPRQGYFPLDPATLAGADAVLHVASA